MSTSRRGPWLKTFVLGVVVGAVLLVGAATAMRYTDQRPFCATSCHLMHEAGLTHKMGTHASLACNECHAPNNLVLKVPFKAEEGLRDFLSNMAGKDVAVPVTSRTKSVINANCKRCHAGANTEVAVMEVKPYCWDCHRSNAHMRQKPIYTRMVADE